MKAKETDLVKLAPKIDLNAIHQKTLEAIKHPPMKTNTLEEFDVKKFRRWNAMPPLGLSWISRIGKG